MISYIRFALAFSILALVTLIVLPFQYLGVKFKLPYWKRVPFYWHRFALWIIGVRVTVKGELPTEKPTLIVANHMSWTDIPTLGSIMELSFIAKQEVNEMPGAGFLAQMQRTVFVKREEKRKVGNQVNVITQRLLDGDVMVLFGEGSTGNGSYISPFKSSLFGAAQYAIANSEIERVIIQPVSIAYTGLQGIPLGRVTRYKSAWYGDLALGPHALFIMMKSSWDIEVTFGEPIEFTAESNRRQISAQAQKEIRRMFIKSVHKRNDEVMIAD